MSIEPVRWCGDAVEMIEQRKLPLIEEWPKFTNCLEVANAITDMVVRGAPAIGVAAAYGVVLAADEFLKVGDAAGYAAALAHLNKARPTAINLMWAIARMEKHRASLGDASFSELRSELEKEALSIQAEDLAANKTMGKNGAALLPDEVTILTHCNAGALATAGYGTALGVIRAAVEAGKKVKVYADETRPYLQGARLTTWELMQDGIDVTLISDVAAGHLFSTGKIDAVVVGSDRIVANGDIANKIGTFTVSVLAHVHQIPFYVAAPWSTVDMSLTSGAEIPIEERSGDEVRTVMGHPVAPPDVKVFNPGFDVTPAKYISAIITELGVASGDLPLGLKALSNQVNS